MSKSSPEGCDSAPTGSSATRDVGGAGGTGGTGASESAAALFARHFIALALLVTLVLAGFWLHNHDDFGRQTSFTLLAGAAFGLFLQRSRFCFFCILRDLFERGDARGTLGVLAALAAGTVGYLVIFGAWVPDPSAGHLPPRAHIGPAGWHLAIGGAIFGLGMALSGSCISAHLYRLGEGSWLSILALLGVVAGFVLGFNTWNWLWTQTIATAPPVWLPKNLGYAGAGALQLIAIGAVALLVMRWVKPAQRAADPPRRTSLRSVWKAVFVERWPTWIGGVGIGILGAFTYLRAAPLGVTAELNRLSRASGDRLGLTPERLEGFDRMAGCRPAATDLLITDNGFFVLALVMSAAAAALIAGQFTPKREPLRAVFMAPIGGVMLGFGAMISIGCSVGTLLSGISALAASGWIFGAAMVMGVWAGIPLRKRLLALGKG